MFHRLLTTPQRLSTAAAGTHLVVETHYLEFDPSRVSTMGVSLLGSSFFRLVTNKSHFVVLPVRKQVLV
jgi:hypothetical protein